MRRPFTLLALTWLLAAGCSSERIFYPDHAVLGGVDLRLSVALSRNFQCCLTSDSLGAAVALTTTDSVYAPSNVTAESIWVANGHESWAAALSPAGSGVGVLRFGAFGGPRWSVGTRVDVYVTLWDGTQRRLLEAASQPIAGLY